MVPGGVGGKVIVLLSKHFLNGVLSQIPASLSDPGQPISTYRKLRSEADMARRTSEKVFL